MTGTPSGNTGPANGRASGPAARRSDASRSAILAAARERFAADGYERATIRAIAKDARIDPSMVMRYFGSKDGLFAAAVTLDLRMPDVSGVPHTEVGHALVSHFLDIWEANEELTAMLRVAVTNRAGTERLQDVFREQVVPVAARVCPDPEQVVTRAGLCAAQLMGLALTRYVVRLPPVVALAREEVMAWLGPAVQRYLTAPSP
ncbi:TetR family transcriptional regulator [Streptomyces sp. NPDC056683]|uniref:TetR/AcrR family transcriptional regulator n=1 Tax=Streptomyces sp. NPDC056683 TaxID=3345910 RepID=UPI0036C33BFD